MIRTLIADDEDIIRLGLAKMLAKDSDLQIVALAEDGEMALEQVRELQPELLLVDINMPFMDGLQFVEALRKENEHAVVIVITGYSDFAFAQKALKLGVFDYLLKPVSEQNLMEVIARAKLDLATKRQTIDYLAWARDYAARNRKMLVSDMLSDWVSGRLITAEVERQCEYLGISLPTHPALTLFSLASTESNVQEWEDTLLFYAAENIATELMEPLTPVLTGRSRGGALLMLCENQKTHLPILTKVVRTTLEEHLPVQVQVAQCEAFAYDNIMQTYETLCDDITAATKFPATVIEARKQIEEQFANPDLSLQVVADGLFISSQHLGRLLRLHGGTTFSDLLTAARIRHAVHLMENKSLKMYEIAEQSGYATQSYFSTAFKRVLGVSPAEYRRTRE